MGIYQATDTNHLRTYMWLERSVLLQSVFQFEFVEDGVRVLVGKVRA